MKLFGGLLTLILAIIISCVAAYFSVVGLAAIFAATFWAVVIMGVSLEAGKIVAAGWLHANWHNSAVNRLHKSYMTMAVVVLMVITALGIYGFLSKGHLEQQASGAPVVLQITQKETRIDQLKGQIDVLTARQTQLDTAVNAIIADNAQGGLRVRRQQAAERAEIRKELDAANQEINILTTELVPLKTDIAEVDAKLGPIKYLAEAFGWKDPEAAVRLVILLLMFAFDPLAVVMVISGLITINEVIAARRLSKESPKIVEDFVFDKDDNRGTHISSLGVTSDSLKDSDETVTPEDVVEKYQAEEDIFKEYEAMQYSIANAPTYIPTITENEYHREENNSNLMLELEKELSPREKDAQQLVEILERRPDLLQNVIEAVREETGNSTIIEPETDNTGSNWMDGLTIPQR